MPPMAARARPLTPGHRFPGLPPARQPLGTVALTLLMPLGGTTTDEMSSLELRL
ncbi:MAG: hypothetical protein L0387_21750 [Acidobacteria bacterium]|nr:hypothetical protein [Acidobacteriota bacterium]MCI0721272.1 hypothetical protein [Acidobacteriota bacterium]